MPCASVLRLEVGGNFVHAVAGGVERLLELQAHAPERRDLARRGALVVAAGERSRDMLGEKKGQRARQKCRPASR